MTQTIGNFTFETCGEIEGLYEITPKVYGDSRGYFMETYQYEVFKQAGLDMVFVQDNQSKSRRGVLRGMHFQKQHPQGKLVRVTKGTVYDVAIDLREGSKTPGAWHGVYLSEEKKNMFYIPPGFAHGFLVISEEAEFVYKCTDYYHPEEESGVMYNDPAFGIEWPVTDDMELIFSEKDQHYAPFTGLEGLR